MVSESEKGLYNKYLAISRSSRNQPFQLRKDFDGFENTVDYAYLRKVANILGQFPQIKPDIFFKAPYSLYPDEQWFDLKFFTTQKAIKAYTVYFKKLQEESPDSEENITFIKDSLRYMGMYCVKNNIPISQYITHANGLTKAWMQHVRKHDVSLYCMMEFSNLESVIAETPSDEVDMLLDNIKDRITLYRNRYKTSKAARKLVQEGLMRVSTLVDKSIKKEENLSNKNLNQQ